MASQILLNTKETAQFLRVSEASVRRWSDAGLLPAQRVGRRRERRFAQSDLQRFLGQTTADPRPAAVTGPATVNVGGASVRVRSHFAPIYSTDLGGLRLSVPFLADGLSASQPCFLVATGAVLERYVQALARDHSMDLAAVVGSGQLVVLDGPGPNAGEAIANWEGLFGKALATRPTVVLRVVGEMACARRMFESDGEMMAYEEAYELMARRYPAVSLCQYDAREWDGETMLRALKSHPDMFEQNIGGFLN
jgi:excisionase family DNA binding protein